jgi:hypothetical protein
MRNMVYWWIIFWVQVIAYGVAGAFGVFHMVYTADVSYISFVIIAVHLLTTLWIGWHTNQVARFGHSHKFHMDSGWYLSELCMMLGMIGTIIGFIYTLVMTIGGGVGDVSQLQRVISELAKGIGTAGWTTLMGLVAALSIKAQMNNLEGLYSREAA